MTPKSNQKDPGSFRDPSGFVFHRSGTIYRQVNRSYQDDFDQFIDSGLYSLLTKKGWLVPHSQTKLKKPKIAYQIIKPDPIPVVSYPYEWSFSMLKAAALLTLRIHRTALQHDMILKDASSFNIQFVGTTPIFIDTLSFERYQDGVPWIAYRQFTKHFLAPLALMAHVDINFHQLLRTNLDGIPLNLASKSLPFSTKLNFGLLSHLHLNARSQQTFATKTRSSKSPSLSKTAQLHLITNLINTTESLKLKVNKTVWSNYYQETNYTGKSFTTKKRLVAQFLKKTKPKTTIDLGANTGIFTTIADKHSKYTISADIDPLAVEKNYLDNHPSSTILPLVVDLTNPSPNLGWRRTERSAFSQRAQSDTALALALIHHLAIANNLPLESIAAYFKTIAPHLIIEFVPKNDSQTQALLSQREDIFPDYTMSGFEKAFSKHYRIITQKPITGSHRTLYLMKAK